MCTFNALAWTLKHTETLYFVYTVYSKYIESFDKVMIYYYICYIFIYILGLGFTLESYHLLFWLALIHLKGKFNDLSNGTDSDLYSKSILKY